MKVPQTAQKQGNGIQLTSQNESATKKKRPFEYTEKEQDEAGGLFSLKDLNPEQMMDLNMILREHIELPRPHSTPKTTYIPSPDMRPEALQDENLTEIERQNLLQQQIYFQ